MTMVKCVQLVGLQEKCEEPEMQSSSQKQGTLCRKLIKREIVNFCYSNLKLTVLPKFNFN
jgi:hypothetical protein